jgi:excisionase family DNA binding protein
MSRPIYPTPSRPSQSIKNCEKPTEYLTANETALYLRRSVGAVHNLVYRKQVPAYKVGARLLFKKEEIDRWVLRNRVIVGYGH